MHMAKLSLNDTDEMSATLSVRMTIAEFKKVRNALANGDFEYTASQFQEMVTKVINAAEDHFIEFGDEPKDQTNG